MIYSLRKIEEKKYTWREPSIKFYISLINYSFVIIGDKSHFVILIVSLSSFFPPFSPLLSHLSFHLFWKEIIIFWTPYSFVYRLIKKKEFVVFLSKFFLSFFFFYYLFVPTSLPFISLLFCERWSFDRLLRLFR